MSIRLSFVYLLLLFSTTIKLSDNKVAIFVSGIKCVSQNKEYAEFTLCEIKAIDRETFEGSLNVTLHKKPINNATLVAKLFRRGFEHLGTLYSFNIDACVFLASKRRNPIALMAYKILGLECCSNINHSCPFNHDLFLHKYRWNSSFVPVLPIPHGHYVLYTDWYTYKKHRAQVSVFLQITDK